MQITKHKNKLVPEMITIACQFGQTHSRWDWKAADHAITFFLAGSHALFTRIASMKKP